MRNKNKLIDTENPINYIYLLEVNGGIQSVFDIYNINKTNVGKKNVAPTKKAENVSILLQKGDIVLEKSNITSKSISKKHNEIKTSVKVAPTVKPKKEVVTKEAYNEYVANLKPVETTGSFTEIESQEGCVGGVCPVK